MLEDQWTLRIHRKRLFSLLFLNQLCNFVAARVAVIVAVAAASDAAAAAASAAVVVAAPPPVLMKLLFSLLSDAALSIPFS